LQCVIAYTGHQPGKYVCKDTS
jgi:hypothetical protein